MLTIAFAFFLLAPTRFTKSPPGVVSSVTLYLEPDLTTPQLNERKGGSKMGRHRAFYLIMVLILLSSLAVARLLVVWVYPEMSQDSVVFAALILGAAFVTAPLASFLAFGALLAWIWKIRNPNALDGLGRAETFVLESPRRLDARNLLEEKSTAKNWNRIPD